MAGGFDGEAWQWEEATKERRYGGGMGRSRRRKHNKRRRLAMDTHEGAGDEKEDEEDVEMPAADQIRLQRAGWGVGGGSTAWIEQGEWTMVKEEEEE